MNSRWRRHGWPALAMLLTLGPVLLALAFMLLYSVGAIGLLSEGWTWRYWQQGLADADTWLSLAYSGAIGAASLLLALAVALALQALLGARLHTPWLQALLFIPVSTPPMVAALSATLWFSNSGVLARLTHALGALDQPQDFATPLQSPGGAGIILIHVLLVAPFLLLLLARLAQQQQTTALAGLAATLGGTRWQIWRHVTVPVLLRAARPTLTVYLMALIGAYEIPLVAGAAHPQMVAVQVQRLLTQSEPANRPQAYVGAALYTGLALLLLWSLLRARAPAPA